MSAYFLWVVSHMFTLLNNSVHDISYQSKASISAWPCFCFLASMYTVWLPLCRGRVQTVLKISARDPFCIITELSCLVPCDPEDTPHVLPCLSPLCGLVWGLPVQAESPTRTCHLPSVLLAGGSTAARANSRRKAKPCSSLEPRTRGAGAHGRQVGESALLSRPLERAEVESSQGCLF